MTKHTISVRNHFTNEDIKNLLDSGSRGIHYWGESDLAYETAQDLALTSNGITVEDFEDSKEQDCHGDWIPVKHNLNLKKIKRGLTVMAKKEPEAYADFVKGDYDMYTGDTFIQCCLFGEVIYG